MPAADFKNVDEYIASYPAPVQKVLECVRAVIRNSIPGVEEEISYKMPAYTLHGAPVLYFAGWKQHYSLYPATARLLAAFKKELAPYKVNKSTVRFKLSDPVPEELIERIARFRTGEVTARHAAI